MKEEMSLADISKVSTALAQLHDIKDVSEIERKAQVLRTYFSGIKGKEIEANEAHKIELQAQRRGGEILLQMKADHQIREGNPKLSNDLTVVSLNELGLSRNDSSYWQILAKIPNDEWKQVLANIGEVRRIGNNLALKKVVKPKKQEEIVIEENEKQVSEIEIKTQPTAKVTCPKCGKEGISYTHRKSKGKPELFILHGKGEKCDLGELQTMQEAMKPFLKPETIEEYDQVIKEVITYVKGFSETTSVRVTVLKKALSQILGKYGLWE